MCLPVCHSVHTGWHDALDLTTQWLQICSNLFNFAVLGPPCAWSPSSCTGSPSSRVRGIFKLVHYEARTVGKRAGGIPLKCFLFHNGPNFLRGIAVCRFRIKLSQKSRIGLAFVSSHQPKQLSVKAIISPAFLYDSLVVFMFTFLLQLLI